jgi:hypothetical protein
MHHRQILLFLFVRGVTTIILDVDWASNGLDEVPTLLCVVSFCGVGQKRKPVDLNREHLLKRNKNLPHT